MHQNHVAGGQVDLDEGELPSVAPLDPSTTPYADGGCAGQGDVTPCAAAPPAFTHFDFHIHCGRKSLQLIINFFAKFEGRLFTIKNTVFARSLIQL